MISWDGVVGLGQHVVVNVISKELHRNDFKQGGTSHEVIGLCVLFSTV